jgi:DNA-directed RNA polymerase subunit beta'
MVLGCYYLTAENPAATLGAGRYFANLDDAIIAYEQGVVDLHAYVWVRFDGQVEADDSDQTPIEEQRSDEGLVTKVFKTRRIREDAEGNVISQYVRTTPGRIIYNKTIMNALIS